MPYLERVGYWCNDPPTHPPVLHPQEIPKVAGKFRISFNAVFVNHFLNTLNKSFPIYATDESGTS
jgi:hypothetical protein